MDNDTTSQADHVVKMPKQTYLPVNRCNLPAYILGSLGFQRFPTELLIDGVYELHRDFFLELDKIEDKHVRSEAFNKYMSAFLCLTEVKELKHVDKYDRLNADYLRLLRGWMFDSNYREGAVIKGWVESRFGLLPRWHKTKINEPDDQAYSIYMHERTTGVYNTNAIESQLDLLYAYCQYELNRKSDNQSHFLLYRGIDDLQHYDVLTRRNKKSYIILANNINSLSRNQERADEFGSTVFSILVPKEKIFYYDGLITGHLQGEREYLAIGGLCEINLV